MKSLAVSEQTKRLDIEEFFNTIHVRNNLLIQIKKNIIELLNELVENKIIQNEVEGILKSGKKKYHLIENLTTSDISWWIKYIQLHEILQKIGESYVKFYGVFYTTFKILILMVNPDSPTFKLLG